MGWDVLTIVVVFSGLFVLQTVLYTYLLNRLKRSVSVARPLLIPLIERDVVDATQMTDSVKRILREIADNGSMSAGELSRRLGLSREHTSRTLKKLVRDGLLIREGKPYRYRLTDLGERFLRSHSVQGRLSRESRGMEP